MLSIRSASSPLKERAIRALSNDMRISTVARIKKINAKEQICYAEVYAPNILDTHGEFMRTEDVAELAHRYLQLPHLTKSIDTNHDNIWNGSYPIESFIARDNDPDYTPGAWVLGIKVPERKVWAKIESGDLNGYSFEAYVKKLPAIVVMTIRTDNLGLTEEADGHQHMFLAVLDDDGRVTGGRTTTDDNHSHEIIRGTATEMSNGHSHRLFIGD